MRNCLHAPHLWTRRLHSPPSRPAKQRIVVIGSGWGGYSFLKDIDYSKYDVRVISPVNHFLFTPLLPSTAVGTLDCHVIQEPVRTIRGIAGYYQAKAKHIDLAERRVTALDIFKEQAVTLGYDYLILACGLKTGTFGMRGASCTS
jgi:NADH dehydrogenase FAD-containing subunit